jgi:hypothetical protein
VRNHLIALNALFAFLARFEHVPSNPIEQIDRPRIPQEASTTTAVVTSAPPSAPSTVTTVFSGSLSGKNPSRSFSVNMGAGTSDAQLSFSRFSSLSLGLGGPGVAGTQPVTGPSVLALDAGVSGGSYTYTVSDGKCSFTLTVTLAGTIRTAARPEATFHLTQAGCVAGEREKGSVKLTLWSKCGEGGAEAPPSRGQGSIGVMGRSLPGC